MLPIRRPPRRMTKRHLRQPSRSALVPAETLPLRHLCESFAQFRTPVAMLYLCRTYAHGYAYMTKHPIPYMALSTSLLTVNQSALRSANS